MKKYFCNPMDLSYKYQFIDMLRYVVQDGRVVGMESGKKCVSREAADPSMVMFRGKYLLFASMSKGFWVSDDLVDWEYIPLKNTPHNDYAPDVHVVGDRLYFCASKAGEPCDFYRTKDPLSGEFERIEGSFAFWDPALYAEDGKLYLYWGCSNKEPLWGTELDPKTLRPVGERVALFGGRETEHGFERIGEDHVLKELGPDASEMEKKIRAYCGTAPYIEGAWQTKYRGRYYLQYAAPGTEYNGYGDGVYVSDAPLGPYVYAENNPYSYKPGGFITGAGHGSTMQDRYGNWWHVSTMRISLSHSYERRIGLFPAGFDADGELFCNQRYGDWPVAVMDGATDPWAEPELLLLSYKKPVAASSSAEGHPPENAVDENIRDFWKAEGVKGEWLQIDLLEEYRVGGVQIDFADDALNIALPEGASYVRRGREDRYIERGEALRTRWRLEGSADGENFFMLSDKRRAETDLPHDFVCLDCSVRYLRLVVEEIPYGEQVCISGLRVFGRGKGEKPAPAVLLRAERTGDLDAEIAWNGDAVGYTVLWGHAPEKLYHSYTVYGRTSQRIGALNRGQRTWVRVDSFNENGITHGKVREIE